MHDGFISWTVFTVDLI